MKLATLQQHLKDTRRYSGEIDGRYGLLTQSAILLALTDGPDTALSSQDFIKAGQDLGVQAAAIRAFWKVEAAGAGFAQGRPKILPEPHRFSRNTGGIFDVSFPTLSYRKWKTRPYPVTQDERYLMMMSWVKILSGSNMDIDAAFASASFGAPQIMGENFKLCGFPDPFSFAEAMARDEFRQLTAFGAFIRNAGILPDLRKVGVTVASWQPVSDRYNGTASRENHYAEKMATSFVAYGGK